MEKVRSPERDLTCMSFSVIDDVRGEALQVVPRFSFVKTQNGFLLLCFTLGSTIIHMDITFYLYIIIVFYHGDTPWQFCTGIIFVVFMFQCCLRYYL